MVLFHVSVLVPSSHQAPEDQGAERDERVVGGFQGGRQLLDTHADEPDHVQDGRPGPRRAGGENQVQMHVADRFNMCANEALICARLPTRRGILVSRDLHGRRLEPCQNLPCQHQAA